MSFTINNLDLIEQFKMIVENGIHETDAGTLDKMREESRQILLKRREAREKRKAIQSVFDSSIALPFEINYVGEKEFTDCSLKISPNSFSVNDEIVHDFTIHSLEASTFVGASSL